MTYHVTSTLRRIKFTREAGAVKRCHTVPTIGHYDVAQHSFNILTMLRILRPECSKNLLWNVIAHDLPERLTGDIPAPAKWVGAVDRKKLVELENEILDSIGFAELPLSTGELSLLKSLDMLELYFWCKDQLQLGNLNVISMLDRIENWWKKQDWIPNDVQTLFDQAICNDWHLMPDLGDEE